MSYKTNQLEYFKRRLQILTFYRDYLVTCNPQPGSDLEKALAKINAEIAENQTAAKNYLIFPFRND